MTMEIYLSLHCLVAAILVKNLDIKNPASNAMAKKATILINRSPILVEPPVGLAKPDTTARRMMPTTSSIMAAAKIDTPCFVFSFPISRRTETLILTEVAVKIVPMYRAE